MKWRIGQKIVILWFFNKTRCSLFAFRCLLIFFDRGLSLCSKIAILKCQIPDFVNAPPKLKFAVR